ncbi:hypothetical protein H6F32_03310 [Anabaena sp. FACHB-1237]|uniref:hypothetical protein n=1 Tax=Anabaena sp. FACHB-1237 TaxID=2692769 RepID=UPI0016808111|nr:hypothetical protein [Anabaena sp. FACHB-1237]MBD2136637.1 hypothetical protein [Anabaena sp. FACHB-1237]
MDKFIHEIFKFINQVITNPPIPHEPHKQSLKNWAMYCLRDRGLIVVYAQNADFAVKLKNGDKLYFKVTTNADDMDNLDNKFSWIIWDNVHKTMSFIQQFL